LVIEVRKLIEEAETSEIVAAKLHEPEGSWPRLPASP
jgi:hypothetical protein